MYRLADEVSATAPYWVFRVPDVLLQLGLSELRQLAEKDIQSKLTKENILSELFSTFTSR